MPQDQLFKETLQAFFREFLELFYPDVAARLDFGRVTFLDKETFTDVPEGSRREADIVAQVYTRDGEPELILIQVEVQTQRRGEFPYRMFEYYALLRLRCKQPVFPVVVYLAPGVGGIVREAYRESLFGWDTLTFHYQAVGLPDLTADDYLEQDNPLAPALSALMRSETARALRRALTLRQESLLATDEARRALLVNLIERYLPLTPQEEEEFRRLIGQPEYSEVRQMITVYEQRGIEMGIIRGKRDTLLRLTRKKFGALPEEVVATIEVISTEEELDVLLGRLVTAASLEEMGLTGDST